MTHMPENYPEEMTKRSTANLARIIRSTGIRTLIVDHHALRDRMWRERMGPVIEVGEAHDVRVLTAAEFLGKAVDQLEANRDKLYGLEGKNEDRDVAGPPRNPLPFTGWERPGAPRPPPASGEALERQRPQAGGGPPSQGT